MKLLINTTFVIILFFSKSLFSYDNEIFIASTTSTSDTGLLSYINNIFEEKFNIKVKVLSLGTGQAIRVAKEGNVEILLTHHKKSEIKFMNSGFGILRYDLMYNDFILVGPKIDNIKCLDIKIKLKQIYDDELSFISRGDDSGTHKKELELWSLIETNPNNNYFNYLNVGQGMGNTLLIANEKKSYTIVDRGTWLAFNKKENLKIICENNPPLFNQYGLMLVNPKINSKLNIDGAKKYINWILSSEGKNLINTFKVKGHQLFFYNYK